MRARETLEDDESEFRAGIDDELIARRTADARRGDGDLAVETDVERKRAGRGLERSGAKRIDGARAEVDAESERVDEIESEQADDARPRPFAMRDRPGADGDVVHDERADVDPIDDRALRVERPGDRLSHAAVRRQAEFARHARVDRDIRGAAIEDEVEAAPRDPQSDVDPAVLDPRGQARAGDVARKFDELPTIRRHGERRIRKSRSDVVANQAIIVIALAEIGSAVEMPRARPTKRVLAEIVERGPGGPSRRGTFGADDEHRPRVVFGFRRVSARERRRDRPRTRRVVRRDDRLREHALVQRRLGSFDHGLAVLVLMPTRSADLAVRRAKRSEREGRHRVRTAAFVDLVAVETVRAHAPELALRIGSQIGARGDAVAREQVVDGRGFVGPRRDRRRDDGDEREYDDPHHDRLTSSVGMSNCGRGSKCGFPLVAATLRRASSSAFSICGSLPSRSSWGATSISKSGSVP